MNQKDSNEQEIKRSHKGHMWMMSICCGLPIIGFLAIAGLGISMPSLETVLLLICPIGMIGMMYLMHRDHCARKKQEAEQTSDDSVVELRHKQEQVARVGNQSGKTDA